MLQFNSTPRLRNVNRNSGRTLLEMMVALTIGMIILLFIGGIYMSSRQTFRIGNAISTMEDGASIVVGMLGENIRQAGYGEIVGSTLLGDPADNLVFQGRAVFGCTSGPFTAAVADPTGCAAGGSANFDALQIGMQGDTVVAAAQSFIPDCAGRQPAATAISVALPREGPLTYPQVRNAYYVNNIRANGIGSLMCQGSGGGAEAVLLEDVQQFKVFFGFDDLLYAGAPYPGANPTQAPSASPRSLHTAAEINAMPGTDPWASVVSVTVCVVLVSRPEEGSVASSSTGAYMPCPSTSAQATTQMARILTNDGLVRRTAQQTFSIRLRTEANPYR
jgi:type IV pilus assembly protein PilW